VSTSAVISACCRLMHHDVKISGARIQTHDLYGSESECAIHYTTAPHVVQSVQIIACHCHCFYVFSSLYIISNIINAQQQLYLWYLKQSDFFDNLFSQKIAIDLHKFGIYSNISLVIQFHRCSFNFIVLPIRWQTKTPEWIRAEAQYLYQLIAPNCIHLECYNFPVDDEQ